MEVDKVFRIFAKIELLARLGKNDNLTDDERQMLHEIIYEIAGDGVAAVSN